jgi:hypothetical protein
VVVADVSNEAALVELEPVKEIGVVETREMNVWLVFVVKGKLEESDRGPVEVWDVAVEEVVLKVKE